MPQRICGLPDCGKPHSARGMCHRHYSLWRITGSPLPAPRVPAQCAIPGCGATSYARTWCVRHWDRWRRTGNPLPPTRAERFLARVEVLDSGCWEWTGARDQRPTANYGRWGQSSYAHRAAWEFGVGPIPPGLVVMHTCDNPPCVNVGHLRLGTQAENMADMVAKRRSRAA